LSPLEARVLLYRYIYCKGEQELANELGVDWRILNRAAWRLKAKLRAHLHIIGSSAKGRLIRAKSGSEMVCEPQAFLTELI
jgi:hypothetical protein